MTDDSLLVLVVSAVWMVLALLYALVPAFAMPGAAVVWGGGAAVFMVLAVAVAAAETAGRRRRS